MEVVACSVCQVAVIQDLDVVVYQYFYINLYLYFLYILIELHGYRVRHYELHCHCHLNQASKSIRYYLSATTSPITQRQKTQD